MTQHTPSARPEPIHGASVPKATHDVAFRDKTKPRSNDLGRSIQMRRACAITGDDLLQFFTTRKAVQAQGSAAVASVHDSAQKGLQGPTQTLPHLGAIQKSFGRYDVSAIQAHVGGEAQQANEAMGSEAYATGNHVAFKQQPSVHTAAHEAAHVIQQRSGKVSVPGGVGQVGDRYERHADAVADAVVQGKSAEHLLDGWVPGGGGDGAVQCKAEKGVGGVGVDVSGEDKSVSFDAFEIKPFDNLPEPKVNFSVGPIPMYASLNPGLAFAIQPKAGQASTASGAKSPTVQIDVKMTGSIAGEIGLLDAAATPLFGQVSVESTLVSNGKYATQTKETEVNALEGDLTGKAYFGLRFASFEKKIQVVSIPILAVKLPMWSSAKGFDGEAQFDFIAGEALARALDEDPEAKVIELALTKHKKKSFQQMVDYLSMCYRLYKTPRLLGSNDPEYDVAGVVYAAALRGKAYELLDAVDEDTYKLLTFLGSGPVEGLAGVSNKLGISFMTWRAGNIASDEVEEVKTRGGNAKVYFKSKSGRDRAAKNSNQVEDKHVMRDMYGWCINFPSESSLHRGYVSSSKDVLYVGYTNPIDALKTTREVDSEVIWIEKR